MGGVISSGGKAEEWESSVNGAMDSGGKKLNRKER